MNIKVFLHSSETKALLCISINFELEMHCDERVQRGKMLANALSLIVLTDFKFWKVMVISMTTSTFPKSGGQFALLKGNFEP